MMDAQDNVVQRGTVAQNTEALEELAATIQHEVSSVEDRSGVTKEKLGQPLLRSRNYSAQE